MNMRLYSVEGNRQHLDGGAMFGNAPKALWSKWVTSDENNRIPLACRAFILQMDDDRHILFEAGIGAFFDPKMKERYGVKENEHVLLKNLATHGLTENDIDVVVLSHLHFDHAGGLLSAYGEKQRLLFPHAQYCVGKEHWEMVQNPHIREKASFIPELHVLLKDSQRLVLIDSHTHKLFGEQVQFKFSHGHTVGMLISEIRVDNQLKVFGADLIPGKAWINPPICMGYDRFPELVVNEKLKYFKEWVDRATILFTHDPDIESGKLTTDNSGKYIVA